MRKKAKARKISEATRELMRQNNLGEKNPMYGRRGKDNPCYGRKHTKKTRRKISASMVEFHAARKRKTKKRVIKK